MIVTILASGPSLTAEDVDYVLGKSTVITVNTTFRVAPWANYHYSNDHDWFETYIDEITRTCAGTPVCGHETWRHPAVCSDYQLNRKLPALSKTPPTLGWGGNSGFAALNLAYFLGAKKIIMLGYDMDWTGDVSHHHGDHPGHLQHKKPGFHRWMPFYDRAAQQLQQWGVDVVNCSRKTSLKSFRRSTIDAEL